jgi:hypothetical protein
MSNAILIIGDSGSGKSTAIRNLDPSDTFIINVMDKSLPFKGAKKSYTRLSADGTTGNYYSSDDSANILRVIRQVNTKRPEIKNLILDDFQYSLCAEFMRRASEKGYDKFTDIGKNAWQIIKDLITTREDLYCYVLSHSDTDVNGKVKCKTIGRMLDDKVVLEGLFSVVLHAMIIDGQYKFLTQGDSIHISKSPMGMFPTKLIDNDLVLVKEHMLQYLNEDIKL